jgi:hypothetical protein
LPQYSLADCCSIPSPDLHNLAAGTTPGVQGIDVELAQTRDSMTRASSTTLSAIKPERFLATIPRPEEDGAESNMPTAPKCLNPLEDQTWDRMVRHRADSCFFHGSTWARVLHDTYRHQPYYFFRSTSDMISEVLPVMEVSSPLTGRRGVSLPFTDFCPLLTAPNPRDDSLLQAVLELGRQRRWDYYECRGGIEHWNAASPSQQFYGHEVELDSDEQSLYRGLKASVRRGVQKSKKAGVLIRFRQDVDSIRAFYRLHCGTRRIHGLPPQPLRFFENIARHILANGQGWLIAAEYEGRMIAGAVFFHDRRFAIYKYGAWNYAFQHLRPNNLLMWEAIKRYAQEGYRSLHFGRTSISDEGLRRFKLGFGACERRLLYGRYDFARKGFVAGGNKSEGWFNAVFRCLPGRVSEMAGEILYPHLS